MRISRYFQIIAMTVLIMACAKEDDEVYIEPAEELSSTKASACRSSLIFNRTAVTTALPFNPYNNAFVHNDKIYVSEDLGDWWQSRDGVSWSKVVLPKARLHKTGHLFSFKNSLWFIDDNGHRIWRWGNTSLKGVFKQTWQLISSKANHPNSWGALESGYVVFKDKIWRFVGDDNFAGDGIVKSSKDMVKWTTSETGRLFPRRRYATYTVYDGKIWMIGGLRFNSWDQGHSWYSTDGVNWNRATTSKRWDRKMHATVVYDNKLWIIGGEVGERNGKCDIWSSRDGLSWTEATRYNNAPFSPRTNHASVVFNNKLWVIGGRDYSDGASASSTNEVWNMRKCSNTTFDYTKSK